jgi:hypothetical protein
MLLRIGKHCALSSGTNVALEMKENKKIIDTARTETIDNIAYEGVTSNNEKTEGTVQHSKGECDEDVGVYESIRFEQLYLS